eukprot:scaffold407745_cov40-Prasinocladus_malaysianus.AAC.1
MYILGLWGNYSQCTSAGRRGHVRRRQRQSLSEYLQDRSRGEDTVSDELLASLVPFVGQSSTHFWHELKYVPVAGCETGCGMDIQPFFSLKKMGAFLAAGVLPWQAVLCQYTTT